MAADGAGHAGVFVRCKSGGEAAALSTDNAITPQTSILKGKTTNWQIGNQLQPSKTFL